MYGKRASNIYEARAATGTNGPPTSLPAGVTPSPIVATTLVVNSGTSWTLTMTPGANGSPPTFVCT